MLQGAAGAQEVTLKSLLFLSDRLDRLRRTRWQWCSMVLLLVFSRMQMQTPIIAEVTGLAQFLVFLALPTQKKTLQLSLRH
jgi:hypothetical protein